MTEQHPITPPPELVQQWFDDARNAWAEPQHYVATRAAQWGADQTLKANSQPTPKDLQIRTSLVERVQAAIHDVEFPHGNDEARAAIREVNAWLRERAGGTRASWLLDNEIEQ